MTVCVVQNGSKLMSTSLQSSGELKYLLVHDLLLVFTQDVSSCEESQGIVKSSSPLCVLFLLETPAVVSSSLLRDGMVVMVVAVVDKRLLVSKCFTSW